MLYLPTENKLFPVSYQFSATGSTISGEDIFGVEMAARELPSLLSGSEGVKGKILAD